MRIPESTQVLCLVLLFLSALFLFQLGFGSLEDKEPISLVALDLKGDAQPLFTP